MTDTAPTPAKAAAAKKAAEPVTPAAPEAAAPEAAPAPPAAPAPYVHPEPTPVGHQVIQDNVTAPGEQRTHAADGALLSTTKG